MTNVPAQSIPLSQLVANLAKQVWPNPVSPGDIANKAYVDLHAGGGSSPVTSVAGRTGDIVLTHSDITDWNAAVSAIAPVQSVAGRTGRIALTSADLSDFASAASSAAPVKSFDGRTGAIVLQSSDVTGALGYIPLNPANNLSELVATAAAVRANIGAVDTAHAAAAAPVQSVAGRTGAIVLESADIGDFASAVGRIAPVTSVAGRTGTIILSSADLSDFGAAAAAAAPVQSVAGRTGAVVIASTDLPDFASAASRAAPVQTVAGRAGNVTLTSDDLSDFNAAAAAAAPVTSVVGRQGAIFLFVADINGAAPLASPAFTGTPTAPTPASLLDNSTRIPTTAWIQAQGYVTSADVNSPVLSVAGRTGNVVLSVSDISGAAPLASPALTGTPTAPTPIPADSSTTLATTAYVQSQNYVTASTAPVTSVAGRTGAIVLSHSDLSDFTASAAAAAPVQSVAGRAGAITLAVADVSGAAALASPTFTGTPKAPTPVSTDNSTKLATTAYVQLQGYVTASAAAAAAPVQSVAGRTGAIVLAVADVSGAAPLASPAFTGTPTAPTATAGNSSQQLANTAFVQGQGFVTSSGAAAAAPVQSVAGRTGAITLTHSDITDWATAIPVTSVAGRTGAITLAVADVSGAAPLASPALTGTPTAPTPLSSDSSTKLSTTAYVQAQGYVTSSGAAAAAPVQSVAGRTGAIVLAVADVSGAAPLASPTFTGTPTAPTPATSDSSTTLSTTAYVKNCIAQLGGSGGTLAPASTTTLGGVIVPTTGDISVDGSGNISVNWAAPHAAIGSTTPNAATFTSGTFGTSSNNQITVTPGSSTTTAAVIKALGSGGGLTLTTVGAAPVTISGGAIVNKTALTMVAANNATQNTQGLIISGNLSGSATTATGGSVYANQITSANDSVAAPFGGLTLLGITHTTQAGAIASRNTVDIVTSQNATSASNVPFWAANTAYTVGALVQSTVDGGVFQAQTSGTSGTTQPSGTGSSFNDGGVTWAFGYKDFELNPLRTRAVLKHSEGGTTLVPGATGPFGGCFGINTQAQAQAGATNLNTVVGNETDIMLAGTAMRKVGIQVVQQAGDVNKGAYIDIGYVLSNQPNTPTWTNGFAVGDDQTGWPVDATVGTLFNALGVGCKGAGLQGAGLKAAWRGLNLQELNCSDAAIRTYGFHIDGVGNLSIGYGSAYSTASGLTIDTNSQVATVAGIAAGGTGWANGDYCAGPNGSVWKVANNSGGAVTSLTNVLPARIVGAAPANPVTLTRRSGSAGSGLTVNLTWTTQNLLTLNPSGNVTVPNQLTVNGGAAFTNLPTTPPTPGSGILWNNGGALCVA